MNLAFWDSSSLIPLCVQQANSPQAHALSVTYRKVVWWGTPVEIRSAFSRLVRTGLLTLGSQTQAQIRLDYLRRSWREMGPSSAVRERAEIYIDRFGLRSGDSFQLAAAWMWCLGSPRRRPFLSGDRQLLDAADQLGFNPIETG